MAEINRQPHALAAERRALARVAAAIRLGFVAAAEHAGQRPEQAAALVATAAAAAEATTRGAAAASAACAALAGGSALPALLHLLQHLLLHELLLHLRIQAAHRVLLPLVEHAVDHLSGGRNIAILETENTDDLAEREILLKQLDGFADGVHLALRPADQDASVGQFHDLGPFALQRRLFAVAVGRRGGPRGCGAARIEPAQGLVHLLLDQVRNRIGGRHGRRGQLSRRKLRAGRRRRGGRRARLRRGRRSVRLGRIVEISVERAVERVHVEPAGLSAA
ncbi:MAG: hypothetical protein CHACPFDD_03348 [Phycisphaerae bacterium]|nr:hypothetical protein [Phycisphaerae bacterium]